MYGHSLLVGFNIEKWNSGWIVCGSNDVMRNS
jgi:hypothetical protein